MPNQSKKSGSHAKTRRTKSRTPAALPTRIEKRGQPLVSVKTEFVHAVYPGSTQSDRVVQALKEVGFQGGDISVCRIPADGSAADLTKPASTPSSEPAETDSLIGAAAKIVGSAVTVGALALAAPIMSALPRLPDSRRGSEPPLLVAVHADSSDDASRAADALSRTGGQEITMSGHYVFSG